MKTIIAALALSLVAGSAFAKCGGLGYCYDYQTGNSYTTRENATGGTTTNGYNTETGSTWSQRTNGLTGRTSGYDSNGNYWSCSSSGNCY